MVESEPPPGGVLDSFRRLCDSGLAQVQNRVELFAVEFQEEKARLLKTLVLAGGVFFLAGVAVIMVTLTVVWLAGERARLPLLVAFSVLYLAGAVGGFLAFRKMIRTAPPPFQDTISELKKDRDWLSSRK
jgi:uncharacterized membrane protein YqjE